VTLTDWAAGAAAPCWWSKLSEVALRLTLPPAEVNVTVTGMVCESTPPAFTTTDPEVVPAGRPDGFTVTEKLPGMNPLVGLTVIHELDVVAEKKLAALVFTKTLCDASDVAPTEPVKLRLPGFVNPVPVPPPPITKITGMLRAGLAALEAMVTFPVYVPVDRPLGSSVTCSELPFGVVPELALTRIQVAEVETVKANSVPG
jgi:hypothetical protein